MTTTHPPGPGRGWPVAPILVFAAISVLLHFAAAHAEVMSPLSPDLLAMALFLYTPLFHYRRERGPSWLRPGNPGKSLAVAAALLLGSTAFFFLYLRLPLPESLKPAAGFLPPLGPFLARHFIATVLPEEVFFRGYIYDAFEEKGREPILPSALCFALAHVIIYPTPYRALTFFPGVVLGWARRKTGAIYVPALLHLFFNTMPYLLPYLRGGGA
jgi:membrane protease YdiL (CAAX protease family)